MSLQPETIIYIGKAVPSSGSGAHTETALLSITTEPAAPFAKGSKYYNSTTKKIYTAVADDTWENADEADPVFGAYYTYGGKTYTWDGDTLEIFELEDYQLIADKTSSYNSSSTITYPNSKALKDGLDLKENVANKTNTFTNNTESTTKYPTMKAVADFVVKESIIRTFADAGITKNGSTYTCIELAEEIRSKELPTGTTLYGEIYNDNLNPHVKLPEGIGNAEVRVEILETKGGSSPKSQVMEFTLFSTDVEPKEWSFIYYNLRNTPWVWVPKAVPTNDYTSQVTTTVPSSQALYNALATKQDNLPSQTGNAGKYLSTNGTTLSWQPAVPTLNWYTDNTGTTISIVDTTNSPLVKIYKNGVLLQPDQDYTISSTTLTIIGDPLIAADKIIVEHY